MMKTFALLALLVFQTPVAAQQLDTLLVLGREIPNVTVTPPDVNVEITMLTDSLMLASFERSMESLREAITAQQGPVSTGSPWRGRAKDGLWLVLGTIATYQLYRIADALNNPHDHPHDHPHEHELPEHEHEKKKRYPHGEE